MVVERATTLTTMTPFDVWRDDLAGWAIPEAILAQAPESPWFHDPAAFAADDSIARDSISNQRAREVHGDSGSVLDVGCGGGRSSLALVPPANKVTGVDANATMLANFADAVRAAGATPYAVEGNWPGVAPATEPADVVVCHHVLYNVAEIEPFVRALHGHAHHRVVVELTSVHPQSVFAPAWWHFWAIVRPSRPTAESAADAIGAMGFDVNLQMGPRSPLAAAAADFDRQVAGLRRRLCLPAERDAEVANWLKQNPIDAGNRRAATLWWDV